ncbi:MAG: SIR2 family NAD-dependent protein deacylase [Desulfatibacillaceae bacterium]
MAEYADIARRVASLAPGVALTGAGISAESGIMTYRDRGGLWDTYAEGDGGGMLGVLAAHPDKAPEILTGFFGALENSAPNPGHKALADLEEAGALAAVVTQNVDDLHGRAGTRTLFELHGNVYRMRCMSCGKRDRPARDEYFAFAKQVIDTVRGFSLDRIAEVLPRCPECNGMVRPDFVGFGEAVQDLPQAAAAVDRAGWMLIAGTSGVVHPAASLPIRAARNGSFVVEVNPEQSALTPHADVFVQGRAGEVLPELARAVIEAREQGRG